MKNSILDATSKSGTTQVAQSPTLCAIGKVDLMQWKLISNLESSRHLLSPRDYLVLSLLVYNGCRVSEVCNIELGDIVAAKTVFIRGLKGSSDRLVTICSEASFLPFLGPRFQNFKYGLNRWYVYRLCRRFGIGDVIQGNSNRAVTHAGRHAFISDLATLGFSSEDIAKIIGHKKVDSTEHYISHKPVRR